jgi:histidinol phosphatase-like PHP family hydrolase
MKTDTVAEKMDKNGFMVNFQRFVINECKNKGVYTLYGSDAHSLASIGNAYEYYKELFGEDK